MMYLFFHGLLLNLVSCIPNDSEPNINSNCILCLICDSFYQNDGNCLQIRKLFSCQKVSILKTAANSFSLSKLFVY